MGLSTEAWTVVFSGLIQETRLAISNAHDHLRTDCPIDVVVLGRWIRGVRQGLPNQQELQ